MSLSTILARSSNILYFHSLCRVGTCSHDGSVAFPQLHRAFDSAAIANDELFGLAEDDEIGIRGHEDIEQPHEHHLLGNFVKNAILGSDSFALLTVRHYTC